MPVKIYVSSSRSGTGAIRFFLLLFGLKDTCLFPYPAGKSPSALLTDSDSMTMKQ